MKIKRGQQASALFTALAILVIAASIVTLLITTQRVGIRRTETLLQTSNSFYQMQQVEIWAAANISQWYQTQNNFPGLPVNFPQTTLNQGELSGKIEDWQAKLNVFALRNRKLQTAFKSLLGQVSPDLTQAQQNSLTENIAEVMRVNPHPKMLGELRSIDEITAKRYNKLLPWLSILPTITGKINLNGIEPELLAYLIPEIDAEQFANTRQQEQGFKSVSELSSLLSDDKIDLSLFTTSSNFFLVTATVDQHDTSLTTYTLMQVSGSRQRPRVSILWRSWNTL